MNDNSKREITFQGGLCIDPFDPDIFPEPMVIAETLSNICRWGGRCRPFFSVLQHSVILSQVVPQEFAIEALVHDFGEAFLMDVPTPIKYDPMFKAYRLVESHVDHKVWEHYGGFSTLPSIVKEYDKRMSYDEAIHLNLRGKWVMEGDIKPLGITIEPVQPGLALDMFVDRCQELSLWDIPRQNTSKINSMTHIMG